MEYYVYQLRKETESLPFYIGKGKGSRCFQHFNEKKITNTYKTAIINKAQRDGVQILVEKIIENVDEEFAFLIEEECIAKYGRVSDGGCLTNLSIGGDGGNMLNNPTSREKWEIAMREINAKPEVKLKRSNSAKSMWSSQTFRDKMYESRVRTYKNDPTKILKKKFQAWSNAKDKWLCATELYQLWVDRERCSYNKLAAEFERLGNPKFHLQKMVKYFMTKSPLDDEDYQTWLKQIKEDKNA